MDTEKIDITQYGFSILEIETISLCDIQCAFCSYPLRNDKGKLLPDKMVFNVIDSLVMKDSFEYICLSHLNEPVA